MGQWSGGTRALGGYIGAVLRCGKPGQAVCGSLHTGLFHGSLQPISHSRSHRRRERLLPIRVPFTNDRPLNPIKNCTMHFAECVYPVPTPQHLYSYGTMVGWHSNSWRPCCRKPGQAVCGSLHTGLL
ncbi:hypothetical protein PAV19gp25 [Psittacine adenovirus 3]|uniref:Uncharacterized protein n=1 Tax=Psittacine adenovirus 3 TaxID=1580497 RepID=A0A0A7JTT9_9ADEN|nr:hypothetical protein SC17_gp25 [Psittacine adenovirus 3]AIZ35786.1 hypothetical protein PAV19gp25 [Psittacine adenovirus 3]